MLRCELLLRCCFPVVVINIYTRRMDRRNADLKIESTSRHHRRMKSIRGRFDTFQWTMNFYFVRVLGDAIQFLAALQVPRFSSVTSFSNFRLVSSGLWFRVIPFEDISVLEGHATSNFRIVFRHWGRKQRFSLKRWYSFVRLHGVISQNTIIWMNTAIKISYSILYSMYELYRRQYSCADLSFCLFVVGPKFLLRSFSDYNRLRLSRSAWHLG
jgi:hypothetical protein